MVTFCRYWRCTPHRNDATNANDQSLTLSTFSPGRASPVLLSGPSKAFSDRPSTSGVTSAIKWPNTLTDGAPNIPNMLFPVLKNNIKVYPEIFATDVKKC